MTADPASAGPAGAHIVIAEFMDAPAVARLRSDPRVARLSVEPTLVDDPARLLALAATADVLIVRNRTQVRGQLLAALQRCRIIGRLGVGLDNIDTEACAARGIAVLPATGANAASVAEYVVGSAWWLLRSGGGAGCTGGLGPAGSNAGIVAGGWPRAAFGLGREIGGRTLGLVGFGSIGRATARLAQGMGLVVVAHDPALADNDPVWAATDVRPLTLDALCAQADVISLHLPLLPATRLLFDAARLARCKAGAVLINSARGGIVDDAAVVAALKAGRLGGAALDVFETEPPQQPQRYADCPNLLLTPHIAGLTQEANERVSNLVAERVLQALG